jgi:uncharacterized membrane protein YcfT
MTATSAPRPAREGWIDAAKGGMIFLVVLLHAHNLFRIDGVPILRWDILDRALATIRVPTFFLISGLFAGRYVSAPWRVLARRKVVGQLRLYVIWSVIYIACSALAEGRAGGARAAVEAITTNGEGWYLLALPLFFVLIRAARRIPPAIQIGVATALALACFHGLVATGLWGVDHMATYYVFFLLGMYASERIRGFVARCGWWIAAGCVTVWAALGLVDEFVDHQPYSLLKAVVTVPGVLAVTTVAACLARWRWTEPLTVMGRHSLPVYVAHPVALAVVVPALIATPLPEDTLPLVAAALSVAASYAVWWLLRRPAPWLFTASLPEPAPQEAPHGRTERHLPSTGPGCDVGPGNARACATDAET